MEYKKVNKRWINRIPGIFPVLIIMLLLSACGKKEETELYHRFPEKTWTRFNLLSFEVPVQKPQSVNIYLFARFEPGFDQDTLGFNMIMNTPSGEERIKEYILEVKTPDGKFKTACGSDFCQGELLLKKGLNLSKTGILKIEIENLTPRMNTEGILGVGIRMEPSEK
jgi:gliding motility-associated lipoprotein GldH